MKGAVSTRWIVVAGVLVALLLAGVASYYASGDPDGLTKVSEDQGFAQTYVSPAENRMLVMTALGIYPFSSQTFAVGDVSGGVKDEFEAAKRLMQVYLGLKA